MDRQALLRNHGYTEESMDRRGNDERMNSSDQINEHFYDQADRDLTWELTSGETHQNPCEQWNGVTLAEFVERKFIPDRVSKMRYAGRTHYQAMLKHILTPEEVNRVFEHEDGRSKVKLKSIPEWPYMGHLPLRDLRPEHVQRLTAFAIERGYSFQTVTHIRSVIRAILSHARKEQFIDGENPASLARLSKIISHKESALTLGQAREVIGAMRYPERDMALISIVTGMNVAEVCGLQWKYVNLAQEIIAVDNESILPMTIAVRKQWYRGQLEDVSASRARSVQVSEFLFQVLTRLKSRERYKGPEDFILISRTGTPVNQTNIVTRRLKPIAQKLEIPSLSWQMLNRTRKALAIEFGLKFQELMTIILSPAPLKESNIEHNWHCRTPLPRYHSKVSD